MKTFKKILKISLTVSSCVIIFCGYSKSSKCVEPENPYGEGGHYAGFNWAMKTGVVVVEIQTLLTKVVKNITVSYDSIMIV